MIGQQKTVKCAHVLGLREIAPDITHDVLIGRYRIKNR